MGAVALEMYPEVGKKIQMKLEVSELNNIIGYIFTENKSITRSSLANIRELFSRIDDNVYNSNRHARTKFNFIKMALKAKLVEKMENESIILSYCRGDLPDREVDNIIKNLGDYKRINYREIEFVTDSISNRLKFLFVHEHREVLRDCLERIENGDYKTYKEANDQLLDIVKKMVSRVREIDNSSDRFPTVDLADGNVLSILTDMVDKIRDPSKKLKSGITFLNRAVGEFRTKRLYTILGLPAGFKSGLLLKLARDFKKFNKEVSKLTTKIPTILYLTMENSLEETIERIFNMEVSSEDISTYNTAEVIEKLRTEGEFTYTGMGDINLVLKYMPNRSISTEDLYHIIDDLADKGYEVLALILDYIKRIRPAEEGRDEKQELKNVSNELAVLSKSRDIIVITAHQLNRDAASTVDSSLTQNKEDVTRYLGRSNIGSSWEVYENSDVVMIANLETKKATNQKYLTLFVLKCRYHVAGNPALYFNQPFDMDNGMRVLDDIYLETPLAEYSLATDFEGITDEVSLRGKRTAARRDVIDPDQKDSDDLLDWMNSPSRAA